MIGAIPVYVDIDSSSLTMCCDSLSAALKERPKAIIVTHLYGRLADVEKIVPLASEAVLLLLRIVHRHTVQP